jgi:hypothetical protein
VLSGAGSHSSCDSAPQVFMPSGLAGSLPLLEPHQNCCQSCVLHWGCHTVAPWKAPVPKYVACHGIGAVVQPCLSVPTSSAVRTSRRPCGHAACLMCGVFCPGMSFCGVLCVQQRHRKFSHCTSSVCWEKHCNCVAHLWQAAWEVWAVCGPCFWELALWQKCVCQRQHFSVTCIPSECVLGSSSLALFL